MSALARMILTFTFFTLCLFNFNRTAHLKGEEEKDIFSLKVEISSSSRSQKIKQEQLNLIN